MKKKNQLNILAVILLGTVSLLLTACGGDEDSSATQELATVEAEVVTLDARGQDVYDTNCGICHSMVGSGAPQSGVLSDWQERAAKGMEGMLNNVMDGFQAMPAMGGCFDCDEEDFRQLIGYMTSGTVK